MQFSHLVCSLSKLFSFYLSQSSIWDRYVDDWNDMDFPSLFACVYERLSLLDMSIPVLSSSMYAFLLILLLLSAPSTLFSHNV